MSLPVVPSVLAVLVLVWVFVTHALESLHFCEQRYPDSYVMQDDCIERQKEAGLWILNYMASHHLGSACHSQDTPQRRILAMCLDNWGNDYVMGKSCIQQKTELYDKLHKQRE